MMDSQFKSTSPASLLEINRLGKFSGQFLAENELLIKEIEQALLPFRFRASSTQEAIVVEGDQVALKLVSKILDEYIEERTGHTQLDSAKTSAIISTVVEYALKHELTLHLEGLQHPLRPMSLSQCAFLERLLSRGERLVFGIGPTSTGKTHLAIAAALNQLLSGEVNRIIVSRPHIVMKGEIVTPAIRADMEWDDQFEYLEDVFSELIGIDRFNELIEGRKLVLMPLGHMRGRTFNDSIIIIDEAQNMTIRKMRMAVTRIGRGSRMILTGDPTQVELLGDEPPGLAHILELLRGSEIATIHHFDGSKIVRNEIVAKLEQLYSKDAEINPTITT